MQMDIKLAEGCGDLTPRWLVKCDTEPQTKPQLGVNGKKLNIKTSNGRDVVLKENGGTSSIISVASDIDKIDVFFELP